MLIIVKVGLFNGHFHACLNVMETLVKSRSQFRLWPSKTGSAHRAWTASIHDGVTSTVRTGGWRELLLLTLHFDCWEQIIEVIFILHRVVKHFDSRILRPGRCPWLLVQRRGIEEVKSRASGVWRLDEVVAFGVTHL